jgi:hypothetical protein
MVAKNFCTEFRSKNCIGGKIAKIAPVAKSQKSHRWPNSATKIAPVATRPKYRPLSSNYSCNYSQYSVNLNLIFYLFFSFLFLSGRQCDQMKSQEATEMLPKLPKIAKQKLPRKRHVIFKKNIT